MPPKKAAAATTKAKQVNGVKPPAKKTATAKPPAKTAAKETKVAPPAAPSKTTTTKVAPKTTSTITTTIPSRKRRAEETDEDEAKPNGTTTKRAKKESTAPIKKAEKAAARTKRASSTAVEEEQTKAPAAKKAKAAPKPRAGRAKVIINSRPTQLLDLYTFGGGEAGELGFSGAKGTKEIKRPRINPALGADRVGIVQFAVGGMHTAALTRDNKILTWGVNDQGALGRDTTWDGGMKEMQQASDDSDSDSDSEEAEINPHESTPGEVDFSGLDHVPEFTQVVAADSATFALTDEGLVYGWGTFRSNEGIFGFSEKQLIQDRPTLVPGLKNITALATGTNHVLALDKAGAVYAWGAGQQNQLGRRILERHQLSSLTPAKFGLRGKFTGIGAGSFHSFAIKSDGEVYSWGLNSFGQTGAAVSSSEDGGPDVHMPLKVQSLSPDAGNGTVTNIVGGSQHSLAITSTGQALAWGRMDGFQVGIDISTLPASSLKHDERNKPRILLDPTPIPNLSSSAVAAGAGTDHSIVITSDGKAYSFGFNEYGQCGVGNTDDVKVAEWIDNTAVRGKQLVAAGCGGQFSVLASLKDAGVKVNGVNGHAA